MKVTKIRKKYRMRELTEKDETDSEKRELMNEMIIQINELSDGMDQCAERKISIEEIDTLLKKNAKKTKDINRRIREYKKRKA